MKRERGGDLIPFKIRTLSKNSYSLSENKTLINDYCYSYQRHGQKLYWAIVRATTDSEWM